MPTMEPIQQSPLRSTKSEGYHYFIPAPSPVEVRVPRAGVHPAPAVHQRPARAVHAAQIHHRSAGRTLGVGVKSRADGRRYVRLYSVGLHGVRFHEHGPGHSGSLRVHRRLDAEGAARAEPSSTSTLGLQGVTPPKPPRVGLDFSSMDGNNGAIPSSSSKYTTANDVISNVADASTFDMTDEEVKLHNKMDNMAFPDNYKPTFPGHESMFNDTQDFGDESYVRHSRMSTVTSWLRPVARTLSPMAAVVTHTAPTFHRRPPPATVKI